MKDQNKDKLKKSEETFFIILKTYNSFAYIMMSMFVEPEQE